MRLLRPPKVQYLLQQSGGQWESIQFSDLTASGIPCNCPQIYKDIGFGRKQENARPAWLRLFGIDY
jgi:hypothetical protein